MYINKRAKYFWKWPTTVRPCVQVLIISYFELWFHTKFYSISKYIKHLHYLIMHQFLLKTRDAKLLLQLARDENVKAYNEEMKLDFL